MMMMGCRGALEQGAPCGGISRRNICTQTLRRAVFVYRLMGRSIIIITYYSTTLVTKAGAWGNVWSSTYSCPALFPSFMGDSFSRSDTSSLLSSSVLVTKFTGRLGF